MVAVSNRYSLALGERESPPASHHSRSPSRSAVLRREPNAPVSRSGSLLQVTNALSRWPSTRRTSLLPALDPSLALFDFEPEEAGPSPRPSFTLDVEDDEMAKALEVDSWYAGSRPRGRMMGVRKDHRLSPRELPAWGGYSSNTLDWDALLTMDSLDREGEPDSPAPRRVLDLGCGIGAHWCLEMLRRRVWEQTQFVGLDAAPVVVPSSVLPYEYSSRLSFVQHNVLKGLPFDDGRLDLVRISSLFSSIPEDKMSDLLDEVHRILTPDGTLSIVEAQAGVLLPPASHPDAPDYYQPVKSAFIRLLEERFINSKPLSLIPAALAMTFGRSETGLAEKVELPGQELGAEDEVDKEETRSRLYLHGYAQFIEGCAPTLAASAFPLPLESSDTDSSLTHYNSAHTRQVAEFDSLVSSYASSLISIASLPHLLTTSLGWEPTMDIEAARQLSEEVIPGFTEQLEENEALARDLKGAEGCEEGDDWEKEELVQIEVVRQQLAFRKREAEAELKEVCLRLGCDVEQRESLGAVRVGRWRARKV